MVTSELRQLRRVRWGVRLTLALGISASLAANILHAHHVLIDQVIAGWPPVAVFATIEAIARVPVRRRWLAGIRLAGLGFVAAIAFWVSYWHMASVAAAHGESGSKYLLPLSVDGLVVVASISLVELTGQISAVETATRAATAPAPAAPQPVDVPVGAPSQGEPDAAAPHHDQPPPRDTVTAVLPPAAAAGDDGEPEDFDTPPADPVVRGGASASLSADTATPAVAADRNRDIHHDDAADEDPLPENPHEAIIWWRARDPALTVVQIAAKVGRSERTVRRILDAATTPAWQPVAPNEVLPPSGPATRRTDPGASGGQPANGAPVEDLAESVTSAT